MSSPCSPSLAHLMSPIRRPQLLPLSSVSRGSDRGISGSFFADVRLDVSLGSQLKLKMDLMNGSRVN